MYLISMIKLSRNTLVFPFTHPEQSGGSAAGYTSTHNMGRSPESVQLWISLTPGAELTPLFDVFHDGPNYRGWYVGGTDTVSYIAVTVHSIGFGQASYPIEVRLSF